MRSKNPALMQKIYDYAERYQRENNGNSPSKSMIGKEMGVTAACATKYLQAMAEKGMITYDGYNIGTKYMSTYYAGSIPATKFDNVVSCGAGDEQEQKIIGTCQLPEMIFGKGDYFIIEATGDSMIDAGIDDGDTVIIEKKVSPNIGDYVVFLDNDGKTALKRFAGEKNGKPVLEFMNKKAYPGKTYECDNFICQGIAKFCIKSF